jgi:hypothetical protein
MSETARAKGTHTFLGPDATNSFQGKDWLSSTSFGDGFRRSIYLLQHEFRWLVLVFFIGGFILSLILIPVNSNIATLDVLITNEIFTPAPDFLLLFDLLVASFTWSLVQRFVIFFGTFILGTFAVYHVLKKVPSLHLLLSETNTIQYPILSTIIAAFLTATILTAASVIVVIVPIIQVLLFFLPVFLVLGGFSFSQSFSLSFGFRVKHWLRILGALILGYILTLFAGTLGVTFYQNIVTVLSLYGIPLGLASPILLSILTQIPVAMVSPLTPLFAVVFFAGARGAYREKQHEKYMRHQTQMPLQHRRYIPFEEAVSEKGKLCQHCGYRGTSGMMYCTRCGQRVKNDSSST